MQGLALVPEPLWWLLGAIVSFYFGARELHHQRNRAALTVTRAARRRPARRPPPSRTPPARRRCRWPPLGAVDPDFNPAVEEWRRLRG